MKNSIFCVFAGKMVAWRVDRIAARNSREDSSSLVEEAEVEVEVEVAVVDLEVEAEADEWEAMIIDKELNLPEMARTEVEEEEEEEEDLVAEVGGVVVKEVVREAEAAWEDQEAEEEVEEDRVEVAEVGRLGLEEGAAEEAEVVVDVEAPGVEEKIGKGILPCS